MKFLALFMSLLLLMGAAPFVVPELSGFLEEHYLDLSQAATMTDAETRSRWWWRRWWELGLAMSVRRGAIARRGCGQLNKAQKYESPSDRASV